MVTLRRLVLSLIVSVALVGMVWGLSKARDTEDVKPLFTDGAVDAVVPKPGDFDVRQARIGIDLAPGYTGVLVVDGREIPEDQLERVAALNQIFYRPGPGTETGALSAGRHTVTAVFWPLDRTRAEAARTYDWAFTAH